MNKCQLPEHMRDLSGAALKEAVIAHKKKRNRKIGLQANRLSGRCRDFFA